jgi:hypothetical protein
MSNSKNYGLTSILFALTDIAQDKDKKNFNFVLIKESINLYFYYDYHNQKKMFTVSVDLNQKRTICDTVEIDKEKHLDLEEMFDVLNLDIPSTLVPCEQKNEGHCSLKPMKKISIKNSEGIEFISKCKYSNT